MTELELDRLGPVDYLVVEFPAGEQRFTGEAAEELLRLHDAGIIRVMDLVIIGKGPDGTVMAQELGDLDDLGDFARIETQLAETLAEEDVLTFGGDHVAGEPRRGARVREPVGCPTRGGHPPRRRPAHHHTAGIPVQAIIAAIEADEALLAEGV